MKKKFASLVCLVSLLLSFGAALAASEPEAATAAKPIVSTVHQDFQCKKCHGVEKPTEAAPDTACKRCHASDNSNTYLGKDVDYQESGKTRRANMHDAHVGPVRCTVCHAIHSAPPQPLYCNNCHQYDVKAK